LSRFSLSNFLISLCIVSILRSLWYSLDLMLRISYWDRYSCLSWWSKVNLSETGSSLSEGFGPLSECECLTWRCWGAGGFRCES
jgi:hypothetical protein